MALNQVMDASIAGAAGTSGALRSDRVAVLLALMLLPAAFTEAATTSAVSTFSFATRNPVAGQPAYALDTDGVGTVDGVTTSLTNGALTTSGGLAEFDPAQGVLVGVTFDVTSSQTLNLTAPVRRLAGSGTGVATLSAWSDSSAQIRTHEAYGNFDQTISAAGAEQLAVLQDVNATTAAQTFNLTSQRQTDLVAAMDAPFLNNFVGVGELTIGTTAISDIRLNWSPVTVNANLEGDNLRTTSSAKAAITWAGQVGLTYDYLQHAAPSFNSAATANDTLTLDFGSVAQGASSTSLGFSIHNLLGERTGLDLVGIGSRGGDHGVFAPVLGSTSNLQAGQGLPYSVFFDTAALGDFSAQYVLRFRDASSVGAAASRVGTQTLTLNVLGSVTAPVPVPPAVWLFLSALGAISVIGRRTPNHAGVPS